MHGFVLAIRSRKVEEEDSLQQNRASSIESEVSHLQKLSDELEQQLAEA